MTGRSIPVPLESLAAVLRGCQGDLVRATGRGADGRGVDVAQVGAAVLPEPFPVALPRVDDPVAPRSGEAMIETFVVDGTGSVTAMGDAPAVAAWWRPAVESLTSRVVDALTPLGVELTGLISVTASATEVDQVIGTPHLDDDQFHPETGTGVVAIAASHDGPRLARGAMACPGAVAGAPLGLDQQAVETWFDGGTGTIRSIQTTGADRVVVFPRFGQLHAGPGLASRRASGDRAFEDCPVRNLLVLRADTAPVSRR